MDLDSPTTRPAAREEDTAVSPTPAADTFQTGQVGTVSSAHFVHDTYSAFISPLLPVLQERLGVGYALAGSLQIFAQLPSLFNPFIGYIADKVNLRWFIILAPAVTATLMSSMGLTSSYLSLALLLLASGVSIACFHSPAPAMIAKVSGKRVGKGMSIFMASGELGRTVGPVVAAAGVAWWGLEGMWRLMFVGWAVSGILYLRLRHVRAAPKRDIAEASLVKMWPTVRQVFVPLIWIMAGGMLLQVALTTYLPLFMSDVLQTNLWLAAASLTILQAAGVVGALTSGTVSDKYGRQRILFIVLVVAPLLLLAFLYGPSWLAVPLLLALGLTVLSPQPVFLAIVQDQFPHNRALANGSYLAVNFLIRAAAIWIVGLMADRFGLPTAFLVSGLAAFVSLPALRYLPH
ncbi:MAG: MFS transporter [Ardenticatenaceae bacterium]|nr:MFS transporter [Ardenticatenaceae bacterium]